MKKSWQATFLPCLHTCVWLLFLAPVAHIAVRVGVPAWTTSQCQLTLSGFGMCKHTNDSSSLTMLASWLLLADHMGKRHARSTLRP